MYKVPKNAKLILYVHGQELTGLIDYVDKKDITVSGVSSINNILRELYAKEGKTFADLINEGRVEISSAAVWEKYDLLSNMLFVKIGKSKTKKASTKDLEDKSEKEPEDKTGKEPEDKSEKEPEDETGKEPEDETGKEPEDETGKEPEDDSELGDDGAYDPLPVGGDKKGKDGEKPEKGKDTKGKKVSLRSVGFKALAGLVGVVVAYVGIGHLNKYFSKKDSNNTSKGPEKELSIDINENGNEIHTTYNLPSDEELITTINYDPNTEAFYVEPEETPQVEETQRVEEEHVEYVPQNIEGHDFTSLGSIIQFDEMETQLDVIDRAAVERKSFAFENLVVADDYDAIHALNVLRENAINRNDDYSNSEYMQALINYVFHNGNYVNGNFVEGFNSLHPFGQYIVIRMSQGQLLVCRDVVNDQLLNEYDDYGSLLYQELLGLSSHK